MLAPAILTTVRTERLPTIDSIGIGKHSAVERQNGGTPSGKRKSLLETSGLP